jgi:signal transduction histidine kinase/DNA-binding response OmpR family regulator
MTSAELRPPSPESTVVLRGATTAEDGVRADLRRLLQARLIRESGLVLIGHPLLMALVVYATWDEVPHFAVLGWGLAVLLATAFRSVWLRTVHRRTLTDRDIWLGVRLTVTLLGVCWGVGAAIATQDLPFAHTALLLVVLSSMIAAALTTLSADSVSFLGFTAAITVPVAAGILVSGNDRLHLAAAIGTALYGTIMAFIFRRAHAGIVDHLRATALLAVSEETARRAEIAMREARDAAERATQARTSFLANMSHEIRTPMNAIMGFVELILDTDLGTEQRRALELVRASSEALLTILNDILDYSKIEAQHLDLESISFDMAKLVHATASLLAVRAREKHIELLADVPRDIPRAMRGDPTRLRQILTNLISNAIKFTDDGEVVVSIAVARGQEGLARLTCSVRDTGIGIAPEQLQMIFGEFAQADASMTRRYGGTGLGLAISQRLVRLMGGELGVTSDVGRGSDFHFTITLPVEHADVLLAPGRAALGGRRVLVVDDNPTNRRILREMLAAEGMAVDEAANAASGLDALHRAVERRSRYDLAILDVQMPDRDGFEFATEIRADPVLASIRLLMLTSAGQRGDGERCRQLGIQAYLTKPASRADLIEALGAVFADAAAAGGPAVITRHSIAESRPTLRVLLAEDNPMNQQVAVAMLLSRGHLVDVVNNGREAVAAVERGTYDVVLMDVQMPEMDGFEATHAIRAMPQARDLPIIALTAHALSGERERCLAHGMTDYLAKPFKGHELFAMIEGHREGSPQTPGAEVPATPDPVDLDGFKSALRDAGAGEAIGSILDAFLTQVPGRLATLEAAATSGNADAITRAAHVLRGAAGTIGARQLAGLLQIVETAARNGDVGEARGDLERVLIEGTAVLDFVRRDREADHTPHVESV